MALTGVQKFQLVVNLLVVFLECSLVDGHAKMTEPPMRSSMWRFGFDTPVNYDDNELFCGGIQVSLVTIKSKKKKKKKKKNTRTNKRNQNIISPV